MPTPWQQVQQLGPLVVRRVASWNISTSKSVCKSENWSQVVMTKIMTPQDSRAEGMVGPALQACIAKLAADTEAEDLAVSTGLLQHLTPSQKHLAALHHHVQAGSLAAAAACASNFTRCYLSYLSYLTCLTCHTCLTHNFVPRTKQAMFHCHLSNRVYYACTLTLRCIIVHYVLHG